MTMQGEVPNTHHQVTTTQYSVSPGHDHLIRFSSHQGKPLPSHIGQADFQRILNEMELGHFRMMSDGLVEDTFPDSYVPFNLDALLNTGIAMFVEEGKK